MESSDKKIYGWECVAMEKVQTLHASPEGSTWDHLTLGMMKYKVQQNPFFPPIQHKTEEKEGR